MTFPADKMFSRFQLERKKGNHHHDGDMQGVPKKEQFAGAKLRQMRGSEQGLRARSREEI
jgi:hypothetical protein